MIDLKAQLYWARVERWIAAALLLEVSILLNTQRDSANYLYSGAPYPTQSLKTSTEERVEAVWGPASRFTRHLAHYTQSRHLIGLRRMAARSPK